MARGKSNQNKHTGRSRKRRRDGALRATAKLASSVEPLRFGTWGITFEAMKKDHGSDVNLDTVLSADERALYHELAIRQPSKAIRPLRDLVAANPGCAVLYNWLMVALQNEGGHDAEIDRLIEYTASRFPNYLFAQFGYLSLLLSKRDVDGATKFLNGRGLLTDFAPDRQEFHISEFAAYCTTMVQYQMACGRPEAAESYLDMLAQVAPDSPQFDKAEAVYLRSRLGNTVGSTGLLKPRRPVQAC